MKTYPRREVELLVEALNEQRREEQKAIERAQKGGGGDTMINPNPFRP